MPRLKPGQVPPTIPSDATTVAPIAQVLAPSAPAPVAPVVSDAATAALAAALVQAIELTRPTPKKTAFNRTVGTPWTPKDGTAKIKLRRKVYQHGMPSDPDFLSNEEISLLNRIKPGTFLGGAVKVLRRKDRGLDIDYPVKTAAQRLKVANLVGAQGLVALLTRLVNEAENPVAYKVDDLDQD